MTAARIADRYEVIRPLGRGSFAQTLLATDTRLKRQVAVKVLHPRAATEWKAYELFEREALVLRELRHHGIPTVHESFKAQWEGAEAAFLVMEYIEGTSLAQLIAQQRHLDATEVTQLFVELLGVLDYLHTRMPPILHRDIKPANVIVRSDGSPALVDFGAVRNVFMDPDESGSTVVGTYGYMPYEQTMGQASAASDLYALAATFLHLVTGRAPPEFMGESGRLAVPASLPCGDRLRAVLTRLLQAAPGDRYQSARETRAALLAESSPPVPVSANAARGNALASLGPTPRALTGDTAALFKRLAHSTWQLMAPTEKPGTRWGVTDVLVVAFFSVITAGVLPALFFSVAQSRRRRLKEFLIHGVPATARVLGSAPESLGFDAKLARVRYEFDVDGRKVRDSDTVLPWLADRWDVGTEINVLYRPDREYDSVIVSTG
jgi:serine/threonine protein kinase